MKRIFCLAISIVILASLAGCISWPEADTVQIESDIPIDMSNPPMPDPDEGEIDIEDDVPLQEYTDEEIAMLSIDMDKIGVFNIGWRLNKEGTDWEETDDLGALRSIYPDFKLIKTEYNTKNLIPTLPKEGQKDEVWYSEATGFEYLIMHFYYKSEIPSTWMQHMYGPADALMPGLTRPIETKELMEALGIPESEVPISEAFDSMRYSTDGYSITGFYYCKNDPGDSVFIVLPEPGYIGSVISIQIILSKPEIISPADRLSIETYGLSPE